MICECLAIIDDLKNLTLLRLILRILHSFSRDVHAKAAKYLFPCLTFRVNFPSISPISPIPTLLFYRLQLLSPQALGVIFSPPNRRRPPRRHPRGRGVDVRPACTHS